MNNHNYCVYIITNKTNTVLYTGVTNNLRRRITEHKTGKGGQFTSKYKVTKLVFYECGSDINAAIDREKQIKGGSRQNKINLINEMNLGWKDLFDAL
ncbi:MAG: GIY-YIG nuclease family protein [Chloroflexota bacterium]|nr:GIY-YIG nuclease family protein [Chloroflexota bacterium]